MLNLSGKLRRLAGGNISLPLSLTRARYREPGKRSEAQVRLPPGLTMLCTKPSSLRSCAAYHPSCRPSGTSCQSPSTRQSASCQESPRAESIAELKALLIPISLQDDY